MGAPQGSRLTEAKVLAFLRERDRILARYGGRPPPANESRHRNRYYYVLRVLAGYQRKHPQKYRRLKTQAAAEPVPADPLEEVFALAEARRRGWLTIEDLAKKLRRSYQTVQKALAREDPPVPHQKARDGKTKLYARADAAAWLRRRWGFTGR